MSIVEPQQWALPGRERFAKFIDSMTKWLSQELKPECAVWTLSPNISPVDFYCYLKARFGEPNGFKMTLRDQSVDNLIQWNYTLAVGDVILDITNMQMRTELIAYSSKGLSPEWTAMEAKLTDELSGHKRDIDKVKKSLEHWHLFVNPFARLSTILDRYEKRLREIEIPHIDSPPVPATSKQIESYKRDGQAALRTYNEVMSLCASIQMLTPVAGEAAVNFLLLLLTKAEIRADKRTRESLSRQQIDVRIKTLHLYCDYITQKITGDEDEFKDFLRLMNKRNDHLHGNIDPQRSTGAEIYFDQRFITLLPKQHSLGEIALTDLLADLNPEDALADLAKMRRFVTFLLSRIEPTQRASVEQAMAQLQLGYRNQTSRIGVILPAARVDYFPISDDASTVRIEKRDL